MSEYVIIRINKIKSREILRDAIKHNLRKIPREVSVTSHIDGAKTHTNRMLRGGDAPNEMAQAAIQSIIEGTGKKLRKNGVVALEVLFSLQVGTKINKEDFFDQSLRWIEDYWRCPIISATVHYDEPNPHMHVIILPLYQGRMRGAALVGHKIHLAAFKKNHYSEVGRYFGLLEVAAIPRFKRFMTASKIVSMLTSDPTLMLAPTVKSALLSSLAIAPAELCAVLGIDPNT